MLNWSIFPILRYVYFIAIAGLPTRVTSTDTVTCEPLTVKQCVGFGYNTTKMPNSVGQDTQYEAEHILQTFEPLIQSGCSSQLKFFLCSVYAPMCTDKLNVHIGPCRQLCNNVRSRCQPILQQFGFAWPKVFNCSKFPRINNHEHMCMDGPDEEVTTNKRIDEHQQTSDDNDDDEEDEEEGKAQIPGSCNHTGKSQSFVYRNSTGHCVQLCDTDYMFTPQNKDLAEIWLTVWTSLCFASTLFTILTFLISSNRLLYPERVILYISVCYNFYSIGYMVRIFSGRKDASCQLDNSIGKYVLAQDGFGEYACGSTFVLLYYCGSAANVWWLLLLCMWILCQRHSWTHEKLKGKSKYFHAIAWAFPAACVIAVLILRVMDADELTGSCFVGNQNEDNLFWFVIVPLFVSVICAIALSILGVLGSLSTGRSQSQHTCKNYPRKQDLNRGDEVFPRRISVYCLLYTVPVVCLLGSYWYEYKRREEWTTKGTPPNVNAYILRIFMSMIIGSTSFIWVCSKQTFHSWRKLFSSPCYWLNKSSKQSLKKPCPCNANVENIELDNVIANA